MWKVIVSRKVAKAAHSMPKSIQEKLETLLLDIRANGPVRGNWPHYS